MTWPTTRVGRYKMASRASILGGFALGLAWMILDGMGWAPWLAVVLQVLGTGGVLGGLGLAAVAGWIAGSDASSAGKQ